MLYSARKHKKQAAPGSCLAVKHIYTMMSVAVPKVCFGLRGQKKWNLVHQINSRQKKKTTTNFDLCNRRVTFLFLLKLSKFTPYTVCTVKKVYSKRKSSSNFLCGFSPTTHPHPPSLPLSEGFFVPGPRASSLSHSVLE